MRPMSITPLVLVLAACAGAQTQFSAAATGRIQDLVECAEEAIVDEGFVISSRDDDAGLLNAENGAAWLRVQVVPDGQGYFVIRVETADADVAQEAASEIVTECGS